MPYVLRVLGLASQGEMDLVGPPRYLAYYDVNYRPRPEVALSGIADITHDLAKALRFPTAEAALAAWRQRSTIMPTRPDGQPNRPLTAYSMTLEEVPQ